MKNYQWILFDIDDTLFHFDSYRGAQLMCTEMGMEFIESDFQAYEAIDKSLWIAYQNGTISAADLRYKRFHEWALKMQKSPHEMNDIFSKAMAEICTPLDGAIDLLNYLKGKVSLGVITNGFTELQQTRVAKMGLEHHFDLFVISEQLGIAKPNPAIFEHALIKMGNPAREKVLMVGDNPDSDILGGLRVGIDTCWLNTKKKTHPVGIQPSYQINELSDLMTLIRIED